ncbi:hypothetical protein D3C81_1416470 [compost metagenome]
MQGAVAIFVDLHAVAHQRVIQQFATEAHQRHVRQTLQDQLDMDAAPCGLAQLTQHPVTGEEVRIGDHQPLPRCANRCQVMRLDVAAMAAVVAQRQTHAAATGRRR